MFTVDEEKKNSPNGHQVR